MPEAAPRGSSWPDAVDAFALQNEYAEWREAIGLDLNSDGHEIRERLRRLQETNDRWLIFDFAAFLLTQRERAKEVP